MILYSALLGIQKRSEQRRRGVCGGFREQERGREDGVLVYVRDACSSGRRPDARGSPRAGGRGAFGPREAGETGRSRVLWLTSADAVRRARTYTACAGRAARTGSRMIMC